MYQYIFFLIHLFKISYPPIIVHPNEDIRIDVSALQSSKIAIPYDFFQKSLFCSNTISSIRNFTIGQKLLNETTYDINIHAPFLSTNSTCLKLCNQILDNNQKKDLLDLIIDDYRLNFKLGRFNLFSTDDFGFPIGNVHSLFNHFIFTIHYKEISNDSYEIIGLSGKSISMNHDPQEEFQCQTNITNALISNENSQIYSYDILFSNEPPKINMKLLSWNHHQLFLLIFSIIDIFALIFVIYYSSAGGNVNNSIDLDFNNAIEDNPWYMIRGDIFRVPKRFPLFCSVIGLGFDLLLSFFICSFITYKSSSEIIDIFLNVLLLTSPLGALISIYIFKLCNGNNWRLMLISSSLFFPFIVILFLLISQPILILMGSSLRFSLTLLIYIFIRLLIWSLLSAIGSFIGLKIPAKDPPFKVNMIPKQISRTQNYLSDTDCSIFIGLIVYLQLFDLIGFVMNSYWKRFNYESNNSIILLFLFCCCCSSAFSTLLFIFLRVKRENYKWWRISISGLIITIFYLLHSIIYFYRYLIYQDFISFFVYLIGKFGIGLFLGLITASFGFLFSFIFLRFLYKSFSNNNNN